MRIYFFFLNLIFPAILLAQVYKTNIRFASKPDYKELKKAVRLTSSDTETSQKAFQMEGPGWENDLVGFRNYFDARNGIDIWGKKTNRMVLDSVGMGKDYHSMDWWGMDILKVGNSLGAGAIALMIGDSLYRIGPGCKGTYKLICETPEYSSFELKFEKWKIHGRIYTITHQISIRAGKRYYESKVTLKGCKGDEYIVSGIVNLHSKEMTLMKEGDMVTLATHDRQAYDGEYLGMAVMLPRIFFSDTLTAPHNGTGITNTYMVKMKPGKNHEVGFRFYSCWEYENPLFAKEAYFLNFLREEMVLKNQP